MKYLEIIPDFLAMYGVFTSQSTSRVRQEMSIFNRYTQSVLTIMHINILCKTSLSINDRLFEMCLGGL